MKKRTALFAGTALLSLAAATALYAVNGDNCITREGYFNLNAASCTKTKNAYAGNDVFGDGAVPANEVDRIDPDADPKTATQAINNVGIVIDGAAPNGAGTDLDEKAKAVRGLIDRAVDGNGAVLEQSIDLKLKNLAPRLDGRNDLANAAGLRLADKVTSVSNRIGTQGGNIISRINSAVGLIDAALDAETATLNKAIANIIGGAAADSTNGVIGTDAAPNGSGEIDNAPDVAAKLRAVQNLISRNANPQARSVAEALIDVRGDGNTGGIIGNPAGDNTASILEQLTALRNLVDASLGGDGNPVAEDIDAAIRNVQGPNGLLSDENDNPQTDGVIGRGGAAAIDAANSVATKLQAFLTTLNAKLTTAAAGGGANKTVTYAPAGVLTLASVEAALDIA